MRHAIRHPLVLLLVLLALAPAEAKESKLERAVAKERAKIAKGWIGLAGELAAKGMQAPAAEALVLRGGG